MRGFVHSGSRLLVSAIIVVSIVSTIAIALYLLGYEHFSTTRRVAVNTGGNQPGASNIVAAGNGAYRLAVRELKKILERARDVYLDALRRNNTRGIFVCAPYSNLSKTLILDTTIVNETTLLIGHRAYRYIVVHIYDAESKLDFMPKKILVGNMLARLVPRNKSVTYTGMTPYEYLVSYAGRVYRASFWSITYIDASYNLTICTSKVSDNMYEARITVARRLGGAAHIDTAWLILVKN